MQLTCAGWGTRGLTAVPSLALIARGTCILVTLPSTAFLN